jgi:hypothetical protein
MAHRINGVSETIAGYLLDFLNQRKSWGALETTPGPSKRTISPSYEGGDQGVVVEAYSY